MSRSPILEDFDTSPAKAEVQPLAEDLPGYQEGYAAALLEHSVRQTGLQAELIQSLTEFGLSYAEARQEVLNGLAGLFDQVIAQVLPDIIAASYGAHLAEALNTAVTDATDHPIILRVPPSQVDAVAGAIAEMADLTVDVRADPTLSEHAALISKPSGEVLLDLDGLLAQMSEYLSTLGTQPEGQQAHG